MKVYIAGPMTGHPAYNVAAFAMAALAWAANGWDVVTPFDSNSAVWRKHHGRNFNPHLDRCEWGDPLLREMFAAEVTEILDSDAVALLPGWEQSKGATLEYHLAKTFEIQLLDATTQGPL